ncbi:MAG TPA: ATP-dependent helicase [Rhodothermales bacterium]|nr:ATP-dependent helicase [Rhodothermales bacterium]
MARRFVLKSDAADARARFSIDYAGALNPQQYAAATASEGPALVIAGAGTGKTRTLVYRVAYLVETGIPPEQIILLTFTRRAASEMVNRASGLLDGRCSRVRGGTFHSFCLGILREFAPRIGFPRSFSILDASDAADVVDVLRTTGGYHKTDKRFPRKRTLHTLFSTALNRDVPVREIVQARYPQFTGFMGDIEALAHQYEQYKVQYGLMDYDDLLRRTLELFGRNDDVRQRVASACRHVLVDEYQDTNLLQACLVRQFASVHGNVMAVGDDAQSIYGFRGADPQNIFAFPDEFPGTRVLKLEQNYRSVQPVLDLSNHIIRHAEQKYEKTLFSDKKDGERPALVQAADDRFESRFICQMILQLREEGVPLNRMAVLFRSAYNSYFLETELNRRNIPFVKYGGLKLNEAAHVKDIVAYLRIAENPKDAVAWNRVLQLLPGIGPKTAYDLIQWITSDRDDPFLLENRPFSPRFAEALRELFDALRTLRAPETPLLQQIEVATGHYEPLLKRKYYEDYPKRLQDLEHFVSIADNFSDRGEFLSSLALDPIELTALEVEATDKDESPLVLSTIHSAKGLEFHTVFLLHALDGVLPSIYTLKEGRGVDEELRLLYVAITRAEENLFISYPVVQYRRSYGEYLSRPSRFLEDIPEDVLEPWTVVEEGASAPALPPSTAQPALSAPSAPGDEDDLLPF